MTPAEELRAAADMLRNRLVSAATEGPWHVIEYDVDAFNTYGFEAGLGTTPDEPNIAGHGYEGGGFDRLCDAQYAAAMHPGVGATLVDLLDLEETYLAGAPENEHLAHVRAALAVARAILGSQP